MIQPKDDKPRILQLLRHAKSSWREAGLEDRDRPLNARGHRAARLLAVHLARQPAPDLVLCSSALRTRETLEHILRAYHPKPPVSIEDALYLATARALVARIEAVDDEVATLLVIGHNPGLHELAAGLARHGPRHDRARLAAKFPTAALASFRLDGSWHAIRHAPIALAAYVVPSDLDATEADGDQA
jgi:phosphohistidine phosphatase